MGFFRRSSSSSSTPNSVRAVAVVRRSKADSNVVGTGVTLNASENENPLNALGFGSIRHTLTLEVRVPGREPFEVTRAEKVPSKATGTNGYQLPPGLELPITMTGPDSNDFQIDWKVYLSSPDRKANFDGVVANNQKRATAAYVESNPALQAQSWAQMAQMMPIMMNAVRSGQSTRESFDAQVDDLLGSKQMDPELAAECKRTLDAEGL